MDDGVTPAVGLTGLPGARRLGEALDEVASSPGSTDDFRGPGEAARRGVGRRKAGLEAHALAFVSDQRIVFTTAPGDPSALALSLDRLETEPFFDHGRAITALAIAPGVTDDAIALGATSIWRPRQCRGSTRTRARRSGS